MTAAFRKEVEIYEAAVRQSITNALQQGYQQFRDILERCEGADPALVAKLLEQEHPKILSSAPLRVSSTELRGTFRRLPAADPSRSQWWFSASGLRYLVQMVTERIGQDPTLRTLCLGAPTLGADLAHRGFRVVVFDVDQQVLDALSPIPTTSSTRLHDAVDELAPEFANSFDFAVIDPPWYDGAIYTFLNRAFQALRNGGELLCTFPPRLTRPGIETFRSQLIRDLVSAGHKILSVEHNTVNYHVPRFEHAVLSRIKNFQGTPWRAGDLIHIRKAADTSLEGPTLTRETYQVFARNPSEFRVFFRGTQSTDPKVIIKPLPDYSSTIRASNKTILSC